MSVISLRDEFDYSVSPAAVTPAGTESHVGLTLGTSVQTSVRIMSDVWADCFSARVWDPVARRVREVSIGNNEFGMTARVEVDATPAIELLAERWTRAQAIRRRREQLRSENARRVDEAVTEAKRVAQYRDVEVVRGRKVKLGTTGRVFWVGDSGFGMSVGIELANGTRVFTALRNVEVAQPDEFFTMPFQTDVNATIRREFYAATESADVAA